MYLCVRLLVFVCVFMRVCLGVFMFACMYIFMCVITVHVDIYVRVCVPENSNILRCLGLAHVTYNINC